MNLRLALIGQSIGHSKSECIYRELLAGSGVNLSYQMLDCATSVDIPSLAELGDRFDGVSITSPYKRFFFDKVKIVPNDTGIELPSINCLRWSNQGETEGTSGDLVAIDCLVQQINSAKRFSHFVIMGDGAMSILLQKYLAHHKMSYRVYSRRILDGQDQLSRGKFYYRDGIDHLACVVWVNCCSRQFLYQGPLGKDDLFWDLNYNSKLQRDYVLSTGADYLDGQSMLKLQAADALRFWGIP
ncbi:MAG: hypothetical protein HN353_03280 [Bdellovibrionales bacterium]|nr:hypothetical protein [Bdellovibrionales bacterium]MBT3526094.1 hypothetical protein [Bdellovibrionales bacterium]MBT7668218.1 hypothetical protein [Bdellovibrionales bacterium]MBT7766465.1 hypothetical protein [Bdellovibrionales bacterium]